MAKQEQIEVDDNYARGYMDGLAPVSPVPQEPNAMTIADDYGAGWKAGRDSRHGPLGLDGEEDPRTVEWRTKLAEAEERAAQAEQDRDKAQAYVLRLLQVKEIWREDTLKAEACAKEAEQERNKISALYSELLYEVAVKHLNETRHETARRYIQQAEQRTTNQAATDGQS